MTLRTTAVNRNLLRTVSVVSVILLNSVNGMANDIEDFFRALRSDSHRNPEPSQVIVPVGHHRSRGAGHPGHPYSGMHPNFAPQHGFGPSSRDVHKFHQQLNDRHRFADRDFDRDHRVDLRHGGPQHPVRVGRGRDRSRVSFHISAGGPLNYGNPGYPVVPVYQEPVIPQYPVIPQPAPVIYEVGQIVDCPVPLASCVRVEDECNIAPNAVPVVVAVRDPSLPPWHAGCSEGVVFVEVCIPPCPLQSLVVSPCRTRIRMDFGHYQVDLKSKNGMVIIDYDN